MSAPAAPEVDAGSFATLIREGLDILERTKGLDAEVMFHTPGVNAMTSMVMCLTLACSARDRASAGWLDA